MTEELKPCPFCGGKAEIAEFVSDCEGEGRLLFFVRCSKCTVETDSDEDISVAKSIWNTRTEIHTTKTQPEGNKRPRPSKHEYYLSIAEAVLARSTCLRRKYGAVIVKDDEIISTGYNGSPRYAKNCCDIGFCYREQAGIPHGERYEACCGVHAEANAIISASRRDMKGATLYLAGQEADGTPVANITPCLMCRRLIVNAGIHAVITKDVDGEIYVADCRGDIDRLLAGERW